METEKISVRTVALLGNPNVGKTTVFNILTGSRQSVGNWPGVTVEHKSGHYAHQGKEIEVIDLPGIYSLTAGTLDEKVTRDYLLEHRPDLVINIVDAANPERNLYLTVQLLELQVPVLIVLTMLDIAEQNGIGIDLEHLKTHLGCRIVPMQLYHRASAELLKGEINSALDENSLPGFTVYYDEVVELALLKVQYAVDMAGFTTVPEKSWLAVKLLEQDENYLTHLTETEKTQLQIITKAVEKHRGQDIRNVIADDRYSVVRGLIRDVIRRKTKWRKTWSDRVDEVVLSSRLGLPIFFFVMFLVFSLTIKAGQPLVSLISNALNWILVNQGGRLLHELALPGEWADFLAQGLGGGMVTIASFIPPIFFIFLSLGWLEDSGYMARAAFVADKFMRRIGLPGKAFIPLLVGFGCTVPAIMATRTLENKRDRIMTSLLTPFMSCGAKLPVYTFLAMIFFPKTANLVVFGLYMAGIVLAMLTGFLLKTTLFKSQPADFIMELPAYHLPTLNGIMMHAWHRLKDFILRAGKTILIVIVVLYVLQLIFVEVPCTVELNATDKISILEYAGMKVTPILFSLGIKSDNWHVGVALISGLFAKEAIVGSLQTTYSGSRNPHQSHANGNFTVVDRSEVPVDKIIREHFRDKASALSLLLFILLYSPCAAALTLLWKEHGKGWMLFAFGFLTLQAWLVASLFYAVVTWSRHPLWSSMTLCILAFIWIWEYLVMVWTGKRYESSV